MNLLPIIKHLIYTRISVNVNSLVKERPRTFTGYVNFLSQ